MADLQAEIDALDNNEHYTEYAIRMHAAAQDPNNPDAHKAANMKFSYLNDNYNVVFDRYRHYMQPHWAPELGHFDHARDSIRPVLVHLVNLMNFINANSNNPGIVPNLPA
jgi:hypothetical protein